MTLKDSTAAISSPGSPDGISPSSSPDGETAPSGQGAAHVSRFRARDNEMAMPTNDTSGPLFTALSPSAGLQRSLANRLQARMAGSGSPLYVLTWSDWDMPAGPPICRLRASELERLNGEIKRRTNVVGIFPNENAITRLVGAILLEQNDEWAVSRRCMTLESIAQTSDNLALKLPTVAA